jgi:hypothetical protein
MKSRFARLKGAKFLGALCELSGIPPTVTSSTIMRLIKTSPDPETAVRQVLTHVTTESDVLRAKWRQIVWKVWAACHPKVPSVPDIGLCSDEVTAVPLLQDAVAYLAALAEHPAQMLAEHKERLLAPAEIVRLRSVLPSTGKEATWEVESEWSYMPLRRLRAVLQALRLVRTVKNQLTVVDSRYERFLSFAPTQQFYVLWHTDVYHTNWSTFSGMWGDFIQLVQDNLSLLWDAHDGIVPDREQASNQWCLNVMETFVGLWHDTGLLDTATGRFAWLKLLRQHSIAPALKKIVLQDLFERHGIIERTHHSTAYDFMWTPRGTAILAAERTRHLPCAMEMLKR